MLNPQLNRHKDLVHLLCTEGLSKALLMQILDRAQDFVVDLAQGHPLPTSCRGKRLLSIGSTQTTELQVTMIAAAHYLGLDVLDLAEPIKLPVDEHGWLEVLHRLSRLEYDVLAVQHSVSGVPYFLVDHLPACKHLINCGDGWHAQPIGALIELLLIRQTMPAFSTLVVTLLGPIQESGLARSLIHALTTVGVPEVRLVTNENLEGVERMGVRLFDDVALASPLADVILDIGARQSLQSQLNGAVQPQRHHATLAVCMAIYCVLLQPS